MEKKMDVKPIIKKINAEIKDQLGEKFDIKVEYFCKIGVENFYKLEVIKYLGTVLWHSDMEYEGDFEKFIRFKIYQTNYKIGQLSILQTGV